MWLAFDDKKRHSEERGPLQTHVNKWTVWRRKSKMVFHWAFKSQWE